MNLEYLHADGVAAYLEKHKGHVLGTIAFGASPVPFGLAVQPAPLTVPIPLLGAQGTSFEVWTSSNPVTPCSSGNITASTDGEVVFGSMHLAQPDGATLQALSHNAYTELFAITDRLGCRHLLRTWNYLPRINEPENGLERYRCFNIGRHDAFMQSGRSINEENIPAASVLGSGTGPMAVYFIASRKPGTPVDNPRQLSAYKYPEKYGPRSPIFVRAMQADFGTQHCLFISGTASIVGHETLHEGDAGQQSLETMRNMRTLLDRAYPSGAGESHGRMMLKVYIRHPGDLPQIRRLIEAEFGATQKAVYLQSDICRSDLLLEIEGVHFSGAQT